METIEFTTYDACGEEEVHELPAKFEVCPRCEGRGSHTNPSIDGNGITSSEWDEWGEEEKETYMSGGYDVSCERCDGQRVVLVVDQEHADPKLLALYLEGEEDSARCRAEQRAERRMEEAAERRFMGLSYYDG